MRFQSVLSCLLSCCTRVDFPVPCPAKMPTTIGLGGFWVSPMRVQSAISLARVDQIGWIRSSGLASSSALGVASMGIDLKSCPTLYATETP